MGYETFTPLFHEVFTKVNNAKDKPKKVAVLRKYDTPSLRNFLMCAFNPDIEWMLPEGEVPYMPNDAPDGTDHSTLQQETKTIHNYVKRKVFGSTTDEWLIGNDDLNSAKREMLFIQLLEGLSAGEAECICLAKDKSLHRKYKGLNANTVREAFGWDENFHDAKLVAETNAQAGARVDLGRTPEDMAYVNRTG